MCGQTLNKIDGNVMAWMADSDSWIPRKCSKCGELDEECICENFEDIN